MECLPPPQQQQQQRGQVQCPVRPSVTPAMVIPMTSNRRKKGNYFFSYKKGFLFSKKNFESKLFFCVSGKRLEVEVLQIRH